MTAIAEEVRRIMAMPYKRETVPNGDGTWFARIVEFPGCMTEGATRDEALSNLDDAMALWVESVLEDGENVPEPLTVEGFSGKFLLRVPRSLHRDLAQRADVEGVSLNQFVSTELARLVAR